MLCRVRRALGVGCDHVGDRALLKHARESLGAHHSPDLFHPQQDISRATSLPLQRQFKAAQDAADKAEQHYDTVVEEAVVYEKERMGFGRPRDYERRIQEAEDEVEQATAQVDEAVARRGQVRDAARAISTTYHPFDLENGEQRDATRAEAELEAQFATIEKAADEARLSSKCRKLLQKARRLLPQMVGTIAFIHTLIRAKVEALNLPEEAEQVVFERLVPALYLEEAAKKAPTAEQRSAVRARALELRATCERVDNPLACLEAGECSTVHEVALECAQLF